MRQSWLSLVVIVPLLAAPEASMHAQASAPITICLFPPAVETGNNAAAATEAVRASFTAFLTGPSVSSQLLQARLASQAREEAKQARCPYILLTTVKVVAKRSRGGLLGQAAAQAAGQGAVEAGIASGTAAGRVAGSAAAGAMRQATYNYAVSIRNRDELTLGYRLEAADGSILVDEKEKRTAKSDGEDLLTPLAESASERILEAAKRRTP
jgi:hypothetical protein